MLTILWIILGILAVILVAAIIVVLYVNARIQQLKKGENYTSEERFNFVSWLVSWLIPLILNIRVNAKGLEKLNQVEHGVIYANHQSNTDITAMLKVIKRPHGYIAKKGIR